MITYREGDLFESNCQTLVCTVNCKGVMGKGIALEFRKNFPEMFTKYRDVCLYDKTQLKHGGDLWLYRYPDLEQFTLWDTDGKLNTGRQSKILCFATKEHWKDPSLLYWITRGLNTFREKYKEWGITSIAFPKLGCNNGGLRWGSVQLIMEDKLEGLDIPVEIYV